MACHHVFAILRLQSTSKLDWTRKQTGTVNLATCLPCLRLPLFTKQRHPQVVFKGTTLSCTWVQSNSISWHAQLLQSYLIVEGRGAEQLPGSYALTQWSLLAPSLHAVLPSLISLTLPSASKLLCGLHPRARYHQYTCPWKTYNFGNMQKQHTRREMSGITSNLPIPPRAISPSNRTSEPHKREQVQTSLTLLHWDLKL